MATVGQHERHQTWMMKILCSDQLNAESIQHLLLEHGIETEELSDEGREHLLRAFRCPFTLVGDHHEELLQRIIAISKSNRPLWLSHPRQLAENLYPQDAVHQDKFYLDITAAALGAMVDPFSFNEHANLKGSPKEKLEIAFDFYREEMKVTLSSERRSFKFRLDLSFDNMKKLFVVQPDERDPAIPACYAFYIYYDYAPVLWQNERQFWERTTELPRISSNTFGWCSVLKLAVSNASRTIGPLMEKLQACDFQIWWTSRKIQEHCCLADLNCRDVISQLESPKSSWEMKCLLAKGYQILDQLNKDMMQSITENKEALVNVLQGMGNTNVFVKFDEMLVGAMSQPPSALNDGTNIPNYVLVPKLIVTPTRLIYMPAEHVKMNRVLREYGSDNFISVSFRDEDEGRIMALVPETLSKVADRIRKFLHSGVKYDDRQFEFLGCSNSQMRSHGGWMYARTADHPEITIESIRQWMGDLSEIRCTAVYVSRLGQFFSSSEHVLDLSSDDYTVTFDYPDVMSNGYCFTDGVGCISPDVAKQISKKLKLRFNPSAFQIRLAGCKGVLSVNPDLEREQVCIRPSMHKFTSDHRQLEVIEYTRPHPLTLNHQVITILSDLGVADQVFLKLLEDELQRLAIMFANNEVAAKELHMIEIHGFTSMLRAGVDFVQDPFWKSLLLVRYEDSLYMLKEKTKIAIPNDKGRLLMGIADESRTLKSEEVFVQYSKSVDQPGNETSIVTGNVVVCKSPCFHPGDVRKFTAVDNPKLNHIKDCIVFPVTSERPHTDEMSGSDLDGDMYWVCWHEDLIPRAENQMPMEFPKQERQKLDHAPHQEDIIRYYSEYIQHDHLGPIANAHRAHADSQQEGIFSKQCLELARIHSEAVDFSKSGKFPDVNPDLRPQEYPDFMMKQDQKQYRSDKVLGQLFRVSSQMYNALLEQHDALKDTMNCTANTQLDLLFRDVKTEQSELDEARRVYRQYRTEMQRLLNRYGIEDESNLIAGRMHSTKGKKLLKGEVYEVGNIIKGEVHAILKQFRSQFQGIEEQECLKKACAWHRVAYDDGEFKSFAWVAADFIARRMQEYPISTKLVSSFGEPANAQSNISLTSQVPSIEGDVVDMLIEIIENNVGELKHHIHRVDLKESVLPHEREYIILDAGYTKLLPRISACILELQDKNSDCIPLMAREMHILQHGLLATLALKGNTVSVEIVIDEAKCELLNQISASNSVAEQNWFWTFANWVKVNACTGSLQNISLIHIWRLALPFLDDRDNGLNEMLQYYSQISNLKSLCQNDCGLWDLPDATFQRLQVLLTKCQHLVIITGTVRILAVCEHTSQSEAYRRVYNLSTDVTNMLNSDTEIVTETLKLRTGCSIEFKQLRVKNTSINIIEGFGTKYALERLVDQIKDFEKIACELRDGSVFRFARSSLIVVLEDLAQDVALRLNYEKSRDLLGRPSFRMRPKLANPVRREEIQLTTQLRAWEENLRFLSDTYDPQLLGKLRIIVRFAKFICYVRERGVDNFSVKDFVTHTQKAVPWGTKGRMPSTYVPRHERRKTAMLPVNANLTRLEAILEKEGFVFCAEDILTVCTVLVKDGIGPKCNVNTSHQVEIIYDEKLAVRHIRCKPIRWSALSYVRHQNLVDPASPVADISVQLQSRREITDRSDPVYARFANPKNPVLRFSEYSTPDLPVLPNLKITPEFEKTVKFIRQKRLRTYKYADSVFQRKPDYFTAAVRVDLSDIKHYDINMKTGETSLKLIKNGTIRMISLPPLHYQKDVKRLTEQIMELSLKISDVII